MHTESRILVVDDNSTNRLILSRSLEKVGYQVITANDGFEAVEVATRHHPDLILMDVMMPGRDGLEACTVLKGQEETAAIPIIFVTAVSETDQVLKAFGVGGCDYVTKPFTSEEVLARVSVHVRLRQVEEELRHKNEQMEFLTKQLAEINTDLAILSRTDPMTRLFNRRTWEEAVVQEHERFERHHCHYSILMIDVDHFKAFNDSQGHQAGDECLRQVAECIAPVCRRVDVVGRYGGEEFVVLAPNTDAEAAVKLAERIRKAIWGIAVPHPASPGGGRVTVSLGVATSGSGSWEDVLKASDDALYVAKKAGRNMVYCSDGTRAKHDERSEADKSSASAASSGDAVGPRVSVLVVDDDSTNRTICRSCLTRAGYQVREAADGHDALASIREHSPDVIVMDIMMPRMDGLECTRRIKANPDTGDIPVIIVSALGKSADILAGLQAGADEYLTKPIGTTELPLRVRSMARQYLDRKDLLRSFQVRGEQMRILARLVEFCRAVSICRCPDDILEHTVAVVGDVARSRRISIMLPDEQGRRLTIAKSMGIDEELAATVKVPIGEPIAGQVFATGRPLVVNSDAEKPPGANSYDSRFFASVPLISTPLGGPGRVVGVLNVTERAGQQPFEAYELEYIELIAKVASTAINDVLSRQAHDRASESIMVGLAKLAEHRDNDTGLHLDRVAQYCRILAEQLRERGDYRDQIDDTFIHNLVHSVPLHDIGKVAIPDHILLYPGKLSEEQMVVMRTHAAIGARTIQSLIDRTPGVDFLVMAADITHYHHEWYNGSGYPMGLEGDAIPLSARITALADVYDALATKRIYKEAFSHDKAVAIIAEASGTQFDPAIGAAFVEREQEFAELAATMVDASPAEPVMAAEPQMTAG